MDRQARCSRRTTPATVAVHLLTPASLVATNVLHANSNLQSQANLRNVQVQIVNGELYCQYDQAITPVQNANGVVFSLNNSYKLLLADGPMSGANLAKHLDTAVTSSGVNVVTSVAIATGMRLDSRLHQGLFPVISLFNCRK
jgi:hypothetical protein